MLPVPGVSVSLGRDDAGAAPPEPMLPDGNARFGDAGGEEESGSMCEERSGWEDVILVGEGR